MHNNIFMNKLVSLSTKKKKLVSKKLDLNIYNVICFTIYMYKIYQYKVDIKFCKFVNNLLKYKINNFNLLII